MQATSTLISERKFSSSRSRCLGPRELQFLILHFLDNDVVKKRNGHALQRRKGSYVLRELVGNYLGNRIGDGWVFFPLNTLRRGAVAGGFTGKRNPRDDETGGWSVMWLLHSKGVPISWLWSERILGSLGSLHGGCRRNSCRWGWRVVPLRVMAPRIELTGEMCSTVILPMAESYTTSALWHGLFLAPRFHFKFHSE